MSKKSNDSCCKYSKFQGTLKQQQQPQQYIKQHKLFSNKCRFLSHKIIFETKKKTEINELKFSAYACMLSFGF